MDVSYRGGNCSNYTCLNHYSEILAQVAAGISSNNTVFVCCYVRLLLHPLVSVCVCVCVRLHYIQYAYAYYFPLDYSDWQDITAFHY